MELIIELGTEELPARFVEPALEALAGGVEKLLSTVAHGEIRTYGTPRRLAVVVSGVAAGRPMVEKLVTGPPASSAWKDGEPGPVALAFAKSKGAEPSALEVVDTPKGRVVAIRRLEGGEQTSEIVAKGLDALVTGISFPKSMRWGSSPQRFGRPLHRVCCVLGGEVVETTVMGLLTVGTSVGHWLHHPEPFPVTDSAHWLGELRNRLVHADVRERKGLIRRDLQAAAEDEGCTLGPAGQGLDEALLDEVNNLVEAPGVIVGEFPLALLELPPRLLIESMKVNQRYFPLFRHDRLVNRFLVVTNNPLGDAGLIAAGNARVLTARFYDARFFYAEDRKKSLMEHGERLAGMTWIRGLGTMAERQALVARAAAGLAGILGASPEAVAEAAAVAKADLCTQMVNEFPELQGHVGRLLAELGGASSEVALAIEEQYLPRGGGDRLPATLVGATLALADRLVLLGLAFAEEKLGLVPRGSADPQGIRRAAIGVLSILQSAGYTGSLEDVLAAAGFPATGEGIRTFDRTALLAFLVARFRAQLLAEGHATDLVEAVLAAGGTRIVPMAARVRGVSELVRAGTFGPIRTTFRRVAGLAKDHPSAAYAPEALALPCEQGLHAAVQALPDSEGEVGPVLTALTELRPVVDQFFDGVLVMHDDPVVRSNRLGLLRAIVDRFAVFADFSRFSTE